VYLRHELPEPVVFGGHTLQYYYTVYLHMSCIESNLLLGSPHPGCVTGTDEVREIDFDAARLGKDAGFHPEVAKGQLLGLSGESGDVDFQHLHFEVRVGTRFSYEFQLGHSDDEDFDGNAAANRLGFDPHVNPYLLFPELAESSAEYMDIVFMLRQTTSDPDVPYVLVESAAGPDEQQCLGDGEVRIRYSSPKSEKHLDRVEFRVFDLTNGELVLGHLLDFSQRIGFNPASEEVINAYDRSRPYMEPVLLIGDEADATTRHYIDIVVPYAFLRNYFHAGRFAGRITCRSCWGEAVHKEWTLY
jgi:hypothetical protein